MTSNRYYAGIKKLQEAFTAEVANEYLSEGWILVSIREFTQREFVGNLPVLTTRPLYVLAYMEAKG